jgi:hypothetical protein
MPQSVGSGEAEILCAGIRPGEACPPTFGIAAICFFFSLETMRARPGARREEEPMVMN